MESTPGPDWLDNLQKIGAIAVAAATVYVYLTQAEALKDEQTNHKAQALLGASRFYGRLATFFGRQALRTEQEYYKVVRYV